jgi:hypothetical protein
MDSRITTIAAMIGVWLLGCQQGAEVDFVRPRLKSVEPASARRSSSVSNQILLELGLWGEPGHSLGPSDRVLAGPTTVWLNELKKEHFVVSKAKVVALRYQQAPSLPLHIVVDNSEVAARWDPQEERLTALRTWVDSLKAMVEGGLVEEPEVSLVVLQGGRVQQVVTSGTLAQVKEALSRSPLLQAPGGRAPLWDGLLAARGRVLLYWGSTGDGDSRATFDQVRASLSQQGVLVAIAGPSARTKDLLALATVSQGVVLEAATTQAIAVQFRTASAVVAGRWVLALDQLPVSGGHVAGAVELHLGEQRWSQSFRLPLLER